MGAIARLAEITRKELDEDELYCIRDANDKVIAGMPVCEYAIEPHKKGGWRVFLREAGRGNVYEDYHFDTEHEACVKFIEMTEDEYHLSRYLSEFEEKKTA